MGLNATRALTLATTLAIACAVVTPANAIVNGQADEGRNPSVGALVSHDGRNRKHRLICSGTLLSPTVFLTAAHCLKNEPANLFVSFDAFVGAPDVDSTRVALHPGTAIGHPQFTDETLTGDTHDIAVVKLDPPLSGVPTAQLPFAGSVKADNSQTYKLVGYGQEGRLNGQPVGGGGRRFATGAFSSLEAFKLRLDQTGATGGTCNGDSGGPVMLGDSATVGGITSDGDVDCASYGIYYRTDTASARDFLDDHVAVPVPPPPVVVAPVSVGGRVLRRFSVSSRRGALVRRLIVDGLPAGASVRMRCTPPKGRSRACPFRARAISAAPVVGLTRAFRARRLPRGTVVTIELTAPGRVGRSVRLTVTRTRVRASVER